MPKSNYRPYFREIAPNYQQENQLNMCFNVKFRAFNLYLSMQLHLYRVYKYYLEAHHVKRFKDLNKAERKQAKVCFISSRQFRNWYNHDYVNTNLMKLNHDNWILTKNTNVPKHTLVHGFSDAYIAFNRYTHGLAKRPHFKNHHSHHSCYFDGIIHVNRVGIKLPCFKLIHFANYGAMPTDKQLANQNAHYKCAYISKHGSRYFISIITNLPMQHCYIPRCQLHGHIGIDVGIKSEVIINALNGYKAHWFKNISKAKKYKRLVIHKHVWQRRMAKRPNVYYRRQHQYNKKHFRPISKGYLHAKTQFDKKCKQITDLTHGYLRKIAYQIIQRKPKSITIEHLDIKGMLSNHKLAKAISRCNWGYFYRWLEWLCRKYGIELRQVSKYYPSTKICHLCHHYNHRQFKGNLSDLSIRNMYCHLQHKWFDRDLNATVNLANAKKYKVLVNPVF